jgi:hypothetical protein
MDLLETPACPGETVTAAEFRHIALTVALAISNPRESLCLLTALNWLILKDRQNRMGCHPPC